MKNSAITSHFSQVLGRSSKELSFSLVAWSLGDSTLISVVHGSLVLNNGPLELLSNTLRCFTNWRRNKSQSKKFIFAI